MMNASSNKALTVLHFLLQNIHACIELSYVKRILPLPLLEAVPGSPPYLAGLMNLAGISIPVIDLGIRLGIQRDKPYSLDMPILLCCDNSQYVGLIVDEILNTVDSDRSKLQMDQEFTQPESPFLGVIPLNAQLTLFLNLKTIIAITFSAETIELNIDHHLINKAKKRHE